MQYIFVLRSSHIYIYFQDTIELKQSPSLPSSPHMPSSLATRRLLHPPSRLTHSLRPVSTHYHPSIQQAYHNIQAHDHGHAGVHAFVALNPPHSAAYPAPDPTDAHPLAGLPIAIKDNFCTSDLPTTACSSILKGSSYVLDP